MEKYCSARRATGDNIIQRMRIACWITKITDVLRIYNTHYFSTATVVTRTRLNIMFIRAYLSCHNCRHKVGYEPCKVHWLIVTKQSNFFFFHSGDRVNSSDFYGLQNNQHLFPHRAPPDFFFL